MVLQLGLISCPGFLSKISFPATSYPIENAENIAIEYRIKNRYLILVLRAKNSRVAREAARLRITIEYCSLI
jgi:hypothetical protein